MTLTLLPTTDNVARPAQAGYGARIDELLLRLAVTPDTRLRIEAAPAQAPRIQLGAASALPEQAVVLTLGDVSYGEGLFYAHRLHSDEDRLRFWRSRGIDTSAPDAGDPEGFGLLHDTELALADTATNFHTVATEDGKVFYADGNRVVEVTSILGSPATTTEDPGLDDRTLVGLARIGSFVYAAVGSGTAAPAVSVRDPVAETWADLASAPQAVERLWASKERLIASYAGTGGVGVVAELSLVDGSPSPLFNLPAGRRASCVADAGTALLIGDDTGKVRVFAPDESGALEEKASVRVGLSDAEYPTAMAAGFGVVLIGTGERTVAGGRLGRLYTAAVGNAQGGFALEGIDLVREFPTDNQAEDHSPTAIVFRKASAYIAVPGLGETVLWRYQVATRGLSLDLIFAVDQDPIRDLVVVDDRLIAGIVGEGLYRESTEYVTEGFIVSPLARFPHEEESAWRWASLHAEVPSQSFAEVYVTDNEDALDDENHTSWLRVILATDATELDTHTPIFASEAPGLAVMVRLTVPAQSTESPRVESASTVGYPQTDELVVTLPVNVSDRIERPGRQSYTVRGFGQRLYRDLLGRRGQSVTLELYREQMLVYGVLEAVGTATPGRGTRSSGLLVAEAVVRGELGVLGASGTLGPTTLGLDNLGIDLLGV